MFDSNFDFKYEELDVRCILWSDVSETLAFNSVGQIRYTNGKLTFSFLSDSHIEIIFFRSIE